MHKKQSGGSGQFADVAIRFEPGEPGSGFVFKSEIKGGTVPKEYIPGVLKGLEEMMGSGSLAGFPVVDVTCVLYDGSYHDVDSSALAFQIAARGCFREAMSKTGARLLEPIMKVEVVTPEDHMGDVIGDLNSRRGVIDKLDDKPGGMKLVASFVPLAEMFQYVSQLRGMTKGRAQYSMKLERYEVVPPNIQTEIVAKVGAVSGEGPIDYSYSLRLQGDLFGKDFSTSPIPPLHLYRTRSLLHKGTHFLPYIELDEPCYH